jgi:hypothetical protein
MSSALALIVYTSSGEKKPTTRIVNDDIAMQAYVGVAQMFQTMQLRCKVGTEPGILLRP